MSSITRSIGSFFRSIKPVGTAFVKAGFQGPQPLKETSSVRYFLDHIPADYQPVGFHGSSTKAMGSQLQTGYMESRASTPNIFVTSNSKFAAKAAIERAAGDGSEPCVITFWSKDTPAYDTSSSGIDAGTSIPSDNIRVGSVYEVSEDFIKFVESSLKERIKNGVDSAKDVWNKSLPIVESGLI